jgi:PD-(D/E)XK nuclease superfamily
MTYSFTQISQYLMCPRRYRHRYLDGWKEKDTRAAMLFGRAFELALGAYFRREDPGDVLFHEWSASKDQDLQFTKRDTWDRMLEQGIMLLTRFCQDDRVRIRQPRRNLQIKFTRQIGKNDFVAYLDGIGKLDGRRCLLEWKTSASRYPEEPAGMLALDPQLVCYSWISGISEVAQVVFVRKRMVEIQYLRTTITDAQREEFGRLVENTIRRIESAEFLPHSGIRFPQNPCRSCPYLGLCLGKQEMVAPAWFGVPEQKTLVGLTSLITEHPPMAPKFNRRRALFVLAKIDEILAWEQRREAERDTKFVELGRYLCEVRAGQYWRVENLKSFDEFLERKFPESRRKAYYLMSIHEHLPPQARKELTKVGWAKGIELAKLARRDRQHFDCATWLHKARGLSKEDFQQAVERELTGKVTERWEIVYFKLYESQMPVIERAIETASLMLGSDRSRGYCLEMICADFLAGANLDHGDPEMMLFSLTRFFKFLPEEQQETFLEGLSEKAS